LWWGYRKDFWGGRIKGKKDERTGGLLSLDGNKRYYCGGGSGKQGGMDTWRTYEWEMESMNESQRRTAGLESSEKKREGAGGGGWVVAKRQADRGAETRGERRRGKV